MHRESQSFDNLSDYNNFNSEVDSTSEDLVPFDDGVIDYCRDFVNTHFYGEKKARDEPDFPKKRRTGRKISLTLNHKPMRKISEPVPQKSDNNSLAMLLKIFHSILVNSSKNNDLIPHYMILVASLRKKDDESLECCHERLMHDYEHFLQIYDKNAATMRTVSEQHWGSCEQLRCGKVITDYLNNGTHVLDPLFGVLMCPYGGQKMNDGYEEEFDKYHRIMFDAFDFLQRYQGKGPGGDYLGSLTLLEQDYMEPEENSRLFWKRTMERIREKDLEVTKKMC